MKVPFRYDLFQEYFEMVFGPSTTSTISSLCFGILPLWEVRMSSGSPCTIMVLKICLDFCLVVRNLGDYVRNLYLIGAVSASRSRNLCFAPLSANPGKIGSTWPPLLILLFWVLTCHFALLVSLTVECKMLWSFAQCFLPRKKYRIITTENLGNRVRLTDILIFVELE